VADVTLALDITVWQEALLDLAVEQLLALLKEIAFFQQAQEKVLRDLMMILGIRMREQVIADTDLLLCQQKALMIMLENFLRWNAAFVRLHRNRRAVAVRPGHHQHMIALQA